MPSPMVFSADLDFSKGDKSAMTAWDRIQGRLDRKPLQVKFDDHMSAPLGRITGNVGEFDSALNAATKRVVSFGAAMIIINQFKNAFGELVKSTVDVEYSLAKINTNINTTKEGLKDFGSKLFDIAKNTGNSFNETAKAAEVLTRQGLSLQESLKRTSDALIMNRLSGISVTDAIKTLTETTNSFNKESLTSADILNRMTVASKNYAVSAHDLEEAVSRAGVTASEAGVSFNQLIALVTTAQQATQRGGNIIGNDLNTIFTNTRESKVIDNLRGLGIAVKDTSGHLLPAIDILRNLSKAYYGLSESNKSAVSQEIAGKRQSDVLLAMLRDLSKEYGVYGNVLNSVSHATNEAYRQNEQLNSTLKGTLAQTSALSTQVFSKVGESGVGPVMKGVVGSINSVLSAGYGDKATDTGKYIGESIVKGISAVLTGPVLIGALKLGYSLVTAFGTQVAGMIKSFGASNTIAEQRAGIQQKINVLLAAANQEEREQINNATTLLERTTALMNVYERIASTGGAMSLKNEALISSVGKRMNIPIAATGFLPVDREQSSIDRGIGGANPTAKPILIPHFAFGRGKFGPIVANTDEYIVPNFAEGGSAIFTKDMVRKYGIPPNAMHLAEGYVPRRDENGRFTKRQPINSIVNEASYADSLDAQNRKNIRDAEKALAARPTSTDILIREAIRAQNVSKSSGESELQNIASKQTEEARWKKAHESLAKEFAATQKASSSFEHVSGESVLSGGLTREIQDRNRKIIRIAEEQESAAQEKLKQELVLADLAKQEMVIKRAANAKLVAQAETAEQVQILEGKRQYLRQFSSKGPGLTTGGYRALVNPINWTETNETQWPEDSNTGPGISFSPSGKIAGSSNLKSIIAKQRTDQVALVNDLLGKTGNAADQTARLSAMEEKFSKRGTWDSLFSSRNRDIDSLGDINYKSSEGKELLRMAESKRSQAYTHASFAAAFALPMLSGFIPEGKGGTGAGMGLGGLRGSAEGAGIGGMIMPGPIGLGGGAAIGGLIGVFSKLNKSIDELTTEMEKSGEGERHQVENNDKLREAFNNLNDGIRENVPEKTLNKLKFEFYKAESNTSDRRFIQALKSGDLTKYGDLQKEGQESLQRSDNARGFVKEALQGNINSDTIKSFVGSIPQSKLTKDTAEKLREFGGKQYPFDTISGVDAGKMPEWTLSTTAKETVKKMKEFRDFVESLNPILANFHGNAKQMVAMANEASNKIFSLVWNQNASTPDALKAQGYSGNIGAFSGLDIDNRSSLTNFGAKTGYVARRNMQAVRDQAFLDEKAAMEKEGVMTKEMTDAESVYGKAVGARSGLGKGLGAAAGFLGSLPSYHPGTFFNDSGIPNAESVKWALMRTAGIEGVSPDKLHDAALKVESGQGSPGMDDNHRQRAITAARYLMGIIGQEGLQKDLEGGDDGRPGVKLQNRNPYGSEHGIEVGDGHQNRNIPKWNWKTNKDGSHSAVQEKKSENNIVANVTVNAAKDENLKGLLIDLVNKRTGEFAARLHQEIEEFERKNSKIPSPPRPIPKTLYHADSFGQLVPYSPISDRFASESTY